MTHKIPNGLHYWRCCKWMKHFNRSILWKHACQGSSRYTKRCIGRKCSVGSTAHKTTNSLDINHLQHASLNWLRGLLKGVLLISKGFTSLLSVFVDPGYLISICITLAVKLMFFVLKALMWFHLGYLVGEVFENEQIQSETYYACGFLGSGSNCSLGNDCVSEFISVLQQLKVYWNRQNVWGVNMQKLPTREGRG
jgi:hypothetical protein